MKKKLYALGVVLLLVAPAYASTIRVYNKTSNPLTVSAILNKQHRIQEMINPGRAHFYNSWFKGITAFEWKTKDGTRYHAPITMRALQTEGRLYIKKDGKYTFKSCLPCKDSQGIAERVGGEKTTPTPRETREEPQEETPTESPAASPSSIPTPPPPPEPVTPRKTSTSIPTPPPPPPVPGKDTSSQPTDLLREIEAGKTLKKVKPTTKVTPEEQLRKEVEEKSTSLKPAQERELKPRPDTRSPRDKLMEQIQAGKELRKTDGPVERQTKHALQDPLEKQLDKRQKQIEALRQAQELEAEDTMEDEAWEP